MNGRASYFLVLAAFFLGSCGSLRAPKVRDLDGLAEVLTTAGVTHDENTEIANGWASDFTRNKAAYKGLLTEILSTLDSDEKQSPEWLIHTLSEHAKMKANLATKPLPTQPAPIAAPQPHQTAAVGADAESPHRTIKLSAAASQGAVPLSKKPHYPGQEPAMTTTTHTPDGTVLAESRHYQQVETDAPAAPNAARGVGLPSDTRARARSADASGGATTAPQSRRSGVLPEGTGVGLTSDTSAIAPANTASRVRANSSDDATAAGTAAPLRSVPTPSRDVMLTAQKEGNDDLAVALGLIPNDTKYATLKDAMRKVIQDSYDMPQAKGNSQNSGKEQQYTSAAVDRLQAELKKINSADAKSDSLVRVFQNIDAGIGKKYSHMAVKAPLDGQPISYLHEIVNNKQHLFDAHLADTEEKTTGQVTSSAQRALSTTPRTAKSNSLTAPSTSKGQRTTPSSRPGTARQPLGNTPGPAMNAVVDSALRRSPEAVGRSVRSNPDIASYVATQKQVAPLSAAVQEAQGKGSGSRQDVVPVEAAPKISFLRNPIQWIRALRKAKKGTAQPVRRVQISGLRAPNAVPLYTSNRQAGGRTSLRNPNQIVSPTSTASPPAPQTPPLLRTGSNFSESDSTPSGSDRSSSPQESTRALRRQDSNISLDSEDAASLVAHSSTSSSADATFTEPEAPKPVQKPAANPKSAKQPVRHSSGGTKAGKPASSDLPWYKRWFSSKPKPDASPIKSVRGSDAAMTERFAAQSKQLNSRPSTPATPLTAEQIAQMPRRTQVGQNGIQAQKTTATSYSATYSNPRFNPQAAARTTTGRDKAGKITRKIFSPVAQPSRKK